MTAVREIFGRNGHFRPLEVPTAENVPFGGVLLLVLLVVEELAAVRHAVAVAAFLTTEKRE